MELLGIANTVPVVVEPPRRIRFSRNIFFDHFQRLIRLASDGGRPPTDHAVAPLGVAVAGVSESSEARACLDSSRRPKNLSNLSTLALDVPEEKFAFQMDFIQQIIEYDEKTGRIKAALIPDPDRYEHTTRDGKDCLYDRFNHLIIPMEEVAKAVEMSGVLPLYSSPPLIADLPAYVESRVQKIRDFLDRGDSTYAAVDKSEEFLQSRSVDKMKFVVLCIDLVGSTTLSSKLPAKVYRGIISLFLRETSAVVSAHHGFVLKYTGDGLIAYFPEPNYIGMNDNAFDCAVAMKYVTMQAVNRVLTDKGLPALQTRIGMDSGEAMISTIGDVSTKQQKDLIGLTMNLASKIQAKADPDQILIGESTARNLHVTRRKLVKESGKKLEQTRTDGTAYTALRADI